MDIVFTVTENTNEDYLRITLRSIELHARKFDEIIIVGHKPDWLQGVVNIPFSESDCEKKKQKEVLKKLIAACISDAVSLDFIHWPVEACILKNMPVDRYPYYFTDYCSKISKRSKIKSEKISSYHLSKFLENRGFGDQWYEGRYPIIYSKNKFLTTFDFGDINFETDYGYGIKTIYCHSNRVESKMYVDLLVYGEEDIILNQMSTKHTVDLHLNKSNDNFRQVILNKFSKKSSYELW